MDNCKFCGSPLSEKGLEKGRTEHFKCRMIKRVGKKLAQGCDMNSQHFEQACKGMDENPGLLLKKFK